MSKQSKTSLVTKLVLGSVFLAAIASADYDDIKAAQCNECAQIKCTRECGRINGDRVSCAQCIDQRCYWECK